MKNDWKIISDAIKYEINHIGDIRNIKRKTLVKQRLDSNGYPTVTLQGDTVAICRKKNHLVHRLIAKAFIDNPNQYNIVNHIDGNVKNFNISNLEWCTQKENIYHSRNISKNGAVISRQKILELYEKHKTCTKEQLVDLLINNCK